MKTTNNITYPMDSNNKIDPTVTETAPKLGAPLVPDKMTQRRLDEYARRHFLTKEGARLVSYLYVNGPANSEAVLAGTNMRHSEFFAGLCSANGVLIMDRRAITIDVCLTSRRAIAGIPESALELKAPAASTVGAMLTDVAAKVATPVEPVVKEDPAPTSESTSTLG